jgi:hypothetical protein
MNAATGLATVNPPRETPPPQLPACPVCRGTLVPLRDAFRCARCHFSVCDSCEGGPYSYANLAD